MTNKNKSEGKSQDKSKLASVMDDTLNWVDARFPLTSNIKAHLT
jgi:ubiquinol-cytochrome c reductase cytochrome b subunit